MFGKKAPAIPRISSFPPVSDADIAFGGYPEKWFQKVKEEAYLHGFDSLSNEYDREVSKLFFQGGSLDPNMSLDAEYLRSGIAIFRAIMGSFRPKHEHKTAVCAYILYSLRAPKGCPEKEIVV